MNNNHFELKDELKDEVKDFLTPTVAELEAEKARYGNLFMNVRKKMIDDIFKYNEIENKFLEKFYAREAGIPEKKADTPAPEKTFSGKDNKDEIHKRYGHFLDKYL